MRVLALDIATETGYYTGDNKPQVVKFPKETRHCSAWEWIKSEIYHKGEAQYDVVVIENAIGQMAYALEVFHSLKTIVVLACKLADIPIVEYSPKTVKKKFTGSGNAKKEDVIAKCLELGIDLPYKVMKSGKNKGEKRYNDNAADAVAIYTIFMEEHDGDS